ncbi:MAG: hypothetical protein ACOX50_00365 [Patescibacteria group bacterium]|jgi:hypothetical protein
MFRAEASFCSERDFQEIAYFENVRLHTFAELSDIVYHVTKIPFVAGRGEADLRELMADTVVRCNRKELEHMVKLRTALFYESQAAREKLHGKQEGSQSLEWVWNKVRDEVEELEKESRGHWVVEDIKRIASAREIDPKSILKAVFDMAQYLGVKNERGIFEFMAVKQRGRIAIGKGKMTHEDKLAEWEELVPVAKDSFN